MLPMLIGVRTVLSRRTVPGIQMAQIGSSFGSNVYFGQEASLCYLAGFGACRSFQALLFQQLAVCFHFVPISLAAEIASCAAALIPKLITDNINIIFLIIQIVNSQIIKS